MNEPRILTVEAERVIAADLRSHLKGLGYQSVGHATNGAQALALAEELRPDLVLMDINIEGEMDGIAIAQEIRRRLQLPVIFVTGFSEGATLEQAKRAEPYSFVIKPFEDRDLRASIEMALYKHRTETVLRQSEERFRTVADFTYDMEYWRLPDGSLTWMSPACEHLTGYTAEQFLQTPELLAQMVHPEDRERIKRHYEHNAENTRELEHSELEFRICTRSGEERWVSHVCRPVVGPDGKFLGRRAADRDITARKRVEEDLAVHHIQLEMQAEELRRAQVELDASRARYFDLYDLAPVGYVTVTESGRLLDVNLTAATLLGVVRSESVGWPPFTRFILAEDQDLYSRHRQQLLKTGKPQECDLRIVRSAGVPAWVHLTIATAQDADGPTTFRIVLIDITARKRADGDLRASQDRYRSLVETSANGIGIYQAGKMVFINSTGARMLGAQNPEALIGRQTEQVVYADDCAAVRERMRRFQAGATDVYPCEVRYLRLDGTHFPAEVRGSVVEFEGQPAMQFIFSDITARKQAAEQLQQSEQRFRLLLHCTPQGIYGVDPQGNCTFANPACLEMFGYEQEADLLGRHMHTLVHHTRPDGTPYPAGDCRMYQALRDHAGTHVTDECFWRRDGSSFPVEYWSHPIIYEGQVLGAVATFNDITARLQAEAEVRKLSQVVAQTPAAVAITNLGGKIEYVNAAFETLTGYTVTEALGQNPSVLKSGQTSADTYQDLWTKLTSGETWRGELLNRAKDGTLFWVLAVISPIKDATGKVTQYMAIKENITARKQAEAELLEANQHLEAATLRANELAAQAVLANAAKSDFLANMSHEIRTPLNGVLGMNGLLLDTALNAEQRRYAETIRSSSDSLLSLLNDILDFSKIEAGRLDLEVLDFNLHNLLDDFTGMIAFRAQQKGLVFGCAVEPGVPAELQGDPGRLRQILTNLTGNAIKFTANGQVVVRVRLVTETPETVQLRFAVCDTGIGIPADKRDRLFAKFSQVDSSTTRVYGGTGLGLAISKQLAELMGGEAGVESAVGKGSEFWFTVRLAKPTSPKPAAAPLPTDLRGARVLIVDDRPVNREILMVLLSSWGLHPAEAADGSAALQALADAKAAQAPFALAILDMQMPGMDGTTLGRAIKSDPNLRDARLVMCTSLGKPGNQAIWEEIGFVAALDKPVRRQELRAVLEAALRGQPSAAIPAPPASAGRAKPVLPAARILVAEDNITNQQVAMGLLKKLGMRVEVAANGLEAIHALSTIPYDLVLMDVQMPELDGLAATRQIRDPQSRVLNHQVTIIAMTAHAMQGDQQKCLQAGMDDYLTKPIEVPALIAALQKWLKPNPAKEVAATPAPPPSAPEVCKVNETAATATPKEPLPIYDRASLRYRALQDEELVREVVTGFLGDLPGQIRDLKQFAAAGEAAKVEQQAHKIKGACAAVGGEVLRALADVLEQAGKAGDLATITARVAEVDAQFAALKEAMTNGN